MKFHVNILHDSKVKEGDRRTDGRTDGPTKQIVEILAGSKNKECRVSREHVQLTALLTDICNEY